MAKKPIGENAVVLTDDTGQAQVFLPGTTDYPDWAAKRMGPHCFEGGEDLFNEDGILQPVVHHDAVIPPARGGDASDGPPPKAGKGSSEVAWREYAAAQGVDVSDVEGRDDIIARLEDADVPTE
jgi:hypothetical protein